MGLEQLTLDLMRIVTEAPPQRESLRDGLVALAADIDTLIGALDDDAPPAFPNLPCTPAELRLAMCR